MKRSSAGVVGFVCVLAVALSGCASYQAAPLSSLSSHVTSEAEGNNDDVVVVAKRFDKTECKRYLDRNVLAKGYQPIQLYIENNSDTNYLFSTNRISLPCARSDEVADKVHTSTVGRVVGYGVGALFLWPLAIPAIVDGVKSAEANDALDTDFAAKTARDQAIAPHSHFNRLIFVAASEDSPSFTVTLVDQASNKTKTLNVSTSR